MEFIKPRPLGRLPLAAVTLTSTLLFARGALACATCGCSLSADAAMGYSAEPGWRLNVEYDFIDQNQLRSASQAVSTPSVAALNVTGPRQEVERGTINRYTNLGLAYTPAPSWSFSITVPVIDRSHSTYGDATPAQLNQAQVSSADSRGIGDVRLIADYQGFLPTHNLGVQWGVKLPTGDYGGQNVATGATVGRQPTFFDSGPNTGSALDTSLNPGTGSTDLILGAFYYQPISQDFDFFANGQIQAAVAEALDARNADFRPGNQQTVSVGLRYEHDPDWIPQLQVNLVHKSADSGALADSANTEGTILYLSPGITVDLGHATHGYGFVQVPIASHLAGFQLSPRWSASVGVSHAW